MLKCAFNKVALQDIATQGLELGTEVLSLNDSRYRAWIRGHGISLGYKIHHKGKVYTKVVCKFGDVSLTSYKDVVARAISDIQLSTHNVKCVVAPTIESFYHNAMVPFSIANHKNQKSITTNWRRLSGELKKKTLGAITRTDILNEVQRLKSLNYAAGSINRTTALLSKMLSLAVSDEIIHRNPVSLVQGLKEISMPPVCISDVALHQYIKAAMASDNVVYACALGLTAVTGARISEITSIKVADIREGVFTIHETKNGRSRDVYHGSVGSSFISKALALSANEYLFTSLFSKTGHINNPRNEHQALINTLLKEGVITTPFKIKSLRSTLGTKLYQGTNDIKAVSLQLGHLTLAITSETYVNPQIEHRKAAICSIEHLFNKD